MSDILVSIVIPTFNGGKAFENLIVKIFNQKLIDNKKFEIIAIDSSSTDGTWEFLKNIKEKFLNVSLFQIEQKDFGHGKTRNFGALKAKGKFVVFITQDILPYDESWLENLLRPLVLNSQAVCAFSKHVPYENSDPLEKIKLNKMFARYGNSITEIFLKDKENYQKDISYRCFLGFYSDNSSIVKREFILDYPYPNVTFAEDQAWSKFIIEKGFVKLYCPESIIYHSHQYNFLEKIKRAKEEYRAYLNIYGYKEFKNIPDLIKSFLYSLYNDLALLKKIKMKKTEKICWAFFYFKQNVARYIAMITVYRGGNENR